MAISPSEPALVAPAKKRGARADFATLLGIALGLGGIIGGLILEGGELKDISQFTAAIIVFGGTFGAVMISTPLGVAKRAARRLGHVFTEKASDPHTLVEEIIAYATKARKNGLVSLEQDAETVADPFLKKSLTLAVDGTDMQEIRKMMELDIALVEQQVEAEAKVFDAAGGYSPTIGIIGAVMGLIQVMKNLANIDEVGHGIAVAFVATVYGVGAANLFFLPMASKIRARLHSDTHRKELILEGVLGIVEGLNPKLIRSKLEAFGGEASAKPSAKKASPAPSPAEAEA